MKEPNAAEIGASAAAGVVGGVSVAGAGVVPGGALVSPDASENCRRLEELTQQEPTGQNLAQSYSAGVIAAAAAVADKSATDYVKSTAVVTDKSTAAVAESLEFTADAAAYAVVKSVDAGKFSAGARVVGAAEFAGVIGFAGDGKTAKSCVSDKSAKSCVADKFAKSCTASVSPDASENHRRLEELAQQAPAEWDPAHRCSAAGEVAGAAVTDKSATDYVKSTAAVADKSTATVVDGVELAADVAAYAVAKSVYADKFTDAARVVGAAEFAGVIGLEGGDEAAKSCVSDKFAKSCTALVSPDASENCRRLEELAQQVLSGQNLAQSHSAVGIVAAAATPRAAATSAPRAAAVATSALRRAVVLLFAALFALLALPSAALAKSSYQIAAQLVADPSKNAKLAVLFSRSDTQPNLKQISQTLKMNGLLQYSYPAAQPQRITFRARAHAAIMLKAISRAFEQIGISYYLPSDYRKSGDEISLGFMINSKTMVDPGALYLVLANMKIPITDAFRSGADFSYELDFSAAEIRANLRIGAEQRLQLKKPLDDYFIELDGAQTLQITPDAADIWYPKILFLDKNLNLISSHLSALRSRQLSVAVPDNSSFAIISDQFSLENIKHGLEISSE